MNDKLNKSKFISEDEGAGLAAPLIDLISSCFIIIVSLWFIYESIKLKVPDQNFLTAPALLPIITSITLIMMLSIILIKSIKKFNFIESKKLLKTINYKKNLISPLILLIYIFGLTNYNFSYELYIFNLELILGSFLIYTIITLTLLLHIYWGKKLILCLLVSVVWSLFLSITFVNFFNTPLPGS
tara:strand:+ start:747 stop:1301 length:555 start_codon:yes stop_codon:yes gene_type:complete